MSQHLFDTPEQLILARQGQLLGTFYRVIAALSAGSLLLTVFLPGFATSEDIREPVARLIGCLVVVGLLYYILSSGKTLIGIYATIFAASMISCYSIYMESPGNMQMLGLSVFPICLGGLLPSRVHFWMVYLINVALMLTTVWLIVTYRNVEIEYRSVVTLVMLQTLLGLLIDVIASAYRQSVSNTFDQLKALSEAEAKLVKLDADLDVAVSQRIDAETLSSQLRQTGELALEVAGAGTLNIDLNSGEIEVSDEFFSRYQFNTTPTNVRQLIACIHPKDRAAFSLLIDQDTQRDRIEGDFQVYIDQPVFWMFMLEANGPQLLRGIIVDVTARVTEQRHKQDIENKLHESQRLESLGVLAGSIAHDFNNLLHVIMLNADLAKQNVNPDSKSATSIDRVMTTVDRAAELCTELLAYSGRGDIKMEPFAIETLVTEMQGLLEISTPKGVVVEFTSDGSNPSIDGDGTQIRQVIMNLITNAGEAMGSTGGNIKINVATRYCDTDMIASSPFIESIRPGSYAAITVSDTGVGMTETVQRKMFDPFFSTKETGHGLGLSAVLGIVRSHNGTINISSEPEVGTTITLLLPVSETGRSDITPSDERPALEPGSATILFADDESEIRLLAKTVLQEVGFTVIEASDGQDAIQQFIAHSESIDLIILDLLMPVKTGLEAHAEILKLNPQIPIAFSSGYNEAEALSKLPKNTQHRFLKKPYLAIDLKEFVQDLLQSAG